jgi:hypothetical protein
MVVEISKIEEAYKRKFETKSINKKTKKWKSFYNAYRRKKIKEIGKSLTAGGMEPKDKPRRKKSGKSLTARGMELGSMVFNGKKYDRDERYVPTKEQIKANAKSWRMRGYNVIIDKRKAGYFVWFKNKK